MIIIIIKPDSSTQTNTGERIIPLGWPEPEVILPADPPRGSAQLVSINGG